MPTQVRHTIGPRMPFALKDQLPALTSLALANEPVMILARDLWGAGLSEQNTAKSEELVEMIRLLLPEPYNADTIGACQVLTQIGLAIHDGSR